MSTPGRGRGRGRVSQKSSEMREPDKSTVDKIHQERASMNSSKSEGPSPPKPEHLDDASTTIGEGKLPPTTKELKDALQGGVQIKEETSDDPVRPYKKVNKQLNPSVAPFVPLLVSGSGNGVGGAASKPSGPVYTKYIDNGNSSGSSYHSTSTSSSNSSQLNPDSKEFIPSFPGNGVPPYFGNGDVSGLDDFEEREQGWQEIGDILRGFEWAVPVETGDTTCDAVLAAGAEILLRVYSYPGSFDEIGRKFLETLRKYKPSNDAITNLAEMFIHWGVKAPEVRYSSCRICHLISDFKVEPNEMFKMVLLDRLQKWHKKNVMVALETDEQKTRFVNFAGFMAEIYSKIEVLGEPVKVLGPLVFNYVEKLLKFGDESFIREGCKILKLTGSKLMTLPKYPDVIHIVTERLTVLTLDKKLSQTCTQLLMQVLELIGTRWGVAAAPIKVTTSASDWSRTSGNSSTKLNKDAPPFVPSEPLSEPYEFETVYNYQAAEQPVAHREDWYDFVGDDEDNYDCTDSNEPDRKLGSDSPEVDYEGLDPEIELEMEAFIDEIEEHLMLQDFDPDIHQNP